MNSQSISTNEIPGKATNDQSQALETDFSSIPEFYYILAKSHWNFSAIIFTQFIKPAKLTASASSV